MENSQENLCIIAARNLPILSETEALEETTKSCIELLQYRVQHHMKEVKETVGDKNIWRLVLCDSVNKEADSLNATNHDAILCSGCGEIPKDVCEKQNHIFDRFSSDLVLVKLQKETKNIYYVLSDFNKEDKVLAATSVEELEFHGKVLYISNGQDPPEAISSEIIKCYFGNYKKFSSNLDKRYIRLIKSGDVQKLEKEILDVACVKYANDENGWTMLHHGAYYGNLEIIHFLTSIGCDGHAQDNICGRKPVFIAAKEGHTDIIDFFLLQGLNVNEADSMGWTLLHYAAWKGNSEAVKFLIQKGAPINAKDKCSGKTSVHVATEEGHLDVVQLLVSSGASIEEKTEEKETPLHCATTKGHFKIAELLVDRGADLSVVDKHGWSALRLTAYKGHFKIAELLVDRGADLNVVNKNGWTPLHYAAFRGHFKIAELLVDRRANLYAKNNIGNTPFACGVKHISVASYLASKMITILQNQGKIDDAVNLFKELLELQKNKLGIVHHETLTTQRKMGEMLYDQCRYSQALDILNDVPRFERDLLSSDFINLRFKCKLKLLIIEDTIKDNEVKEIFKNIFNIQNYNTFTQTEENSKNNTFTQTEENHLQEICKNVFDLQDDTNHCFECQSAVTLILEQGNIVEGVNENINAPIGKSKNIFTQTETADFGKACEYKTSFILRQSRCIHVGMIFFGLCLLLFVNMLFFCFKKY